MASVDRFLIVDDNEANILFFQTLLAQNGKNQASAATTGAQAEDVAIRTNIQFVICAWEMVPMTGTVFVQRLKSNKKFKHVPCVIYSKRMSQEDIELTKDLGLKNVLGMPFDKQGATELILKLIEEEESLTPIEKKLRKIEGYLAENKPSEALKMVDPSLTKKSPLRPRVNTTLGEIWISIKKLDKAEASINAAIEEDPEYTPAYYLKAKLKSIQGKHEESIKILNELADKSPNNIGTLLKLGSAYVEADKHDLAVETFEKAEKLDAENQGLKDEKGKLAFKEGNLDLAVQLLAETENGDDIARHFNNLAIAYVNKGDFERGIETYRNAVKVLSDKAKTHLLKYNLGLALRKKGDLEPAFDELALSYISEPSFEKAYVALARVHKEIKTKGGKPNQERVDQVKEARAEFKASQESGEEGAA